MPQTTLVRKRCCDGWDIFLAVAVLVVLGAGAEWGVDVVVGLFDGREPVESSIGPAYPDLEIYDLIGGGFPPTMNELGPSARVREREEASRIIVKLRRETAVFDAASAKVRPNSAARMLACDEYAWVSHLLNKQVNDAQFSTETQQLLWSEFEAASAVEQRNCAHHRLNPGVEPILPRPATAPPQREARFFNSYFEVQL